MTTTGSPIHATIVNMRVIKSLYRSLLHWTKQERFKYTQFTYHLKELPIYPVLSTTATTTGINVLTRATNMTGVRLTIRYLFRHIPYSKENFQLGYACYRHMLGKNAILEQMEVKRQFTSQEFIAKRCPFQVGDPVIHKTSGCRGVVVGWNLDSTLNKYVITWILDYYDVVEYSNSNQLNGMEIEDLASQVLLNSISDVLLPQTDSNLMRIHNMHLSHYFTSFSSSVLKYIPNKELEYQYPLDQEEEVVLKRLRVSKTSLLAYEKMYNYTLQLSQSIRVIINKYKQQALQYDPIVNQILTNLLDDIQETLHYLKEEELSSHFKTQLLQLRKSTTNRYNTGDLKTFSKQLNSENLEKIANFANISELLTEKLQNIILYGQYTQDVSLAEIVSKRLQSCLKLYEDIKQLLQLRYQNIGYSDLEDVLSLRIQQYFNINQAISTDIMNIKTDQSKQHDDNSGVISTHSEVLFPIGTTIRHKLHGYRGVIVGWDQRPLTMVNHWSDVANSVLKQEQPFYKIVPDEGDIRRIYRIENIFTGYYYCPQDILEIVPSQDSNYRPYHRELKTYFSGYNRDTKRFIPHDPLRYCFDAPPPSSTSTTTCPSTTVVNMHDIAFQLLDNILIDANVAFKASFLQIRNYSQPKSFFNQTNNSHTSYATIYHENDINSNTQTTNRNNRSGSASSSKSKDKLYLSDIEYLMIHSESIQESQHYDRFVSLIYKEHTQPSINLLRREVDLLLLRGDYQRAYTLLLEIVKLDAESGKIDGKSMKIDGGSMYYEPYYMLSSFSPINPSTTTSTSTEQHQEQAEVVESSTTVEANEESEDDSRMHLEDRLKYALLVLEYNPRHYGALISIGKIYKQLGNIRLALNALNAALKVCPYAPGIAAIVNLLLIELNKEQKKTYRHSGSGIYLSKTPSFKQLISNSNKKANNTSNKDSVRDTITASSQILLNLKNKYYHTEEEKQVMLALVELFRSDCESNSRLPSIQVCCEILSELKHHDCSNSYEMKQIIGVVTDALTRNFKQQLEKGGQSQSTASLIIDNNIRSSSSDTTSATATTAVSSATIGVVSAADICQALSGVKQMSTDDHYVLKLLDILYKYLDYAMQQQQKRQGNAIKSVLVKVEVVQMAIVSMSHMSDKIPIVRDTLHLLHLLRATATTEHDQE